ncbi:DUF2511 domain-containing protein [Mycobacterium sp. NPDC003449]
MRLSVSAAGFTLVMLMASGCSTGGDVASKTTTPSAIATTVSESSAAPSAPATAERPAGYVSRETWSDGPWPLTVDEAVLECQGDGLVTITAGESKYSLNAAANTQTGLPDYADPIGLPDPNRSGFHIDGGPLIQRGLALCGGPADPTTPTGGSNKLAGLVERQT